MIRLYPGGSYALALAARSRSCGRALSPAPCPPNPPSSRWPAPSSRLLPLWACQIYPSLEISRCPRLAAQPVTAPKAPTSDGCSRSPGKRCHGRSSRRSRSRSIGMRADGARGDSVPVIVCRLVLPGLAVGALLARPLPLAAQDGALDAYVAEGLRANLRLRRNVSAFGGRRRRCGAQMAAGCRLSTSMRAIRSDPGIFSTSARW